MDKAKEVLLPEIFKNANGDINAASIKCTRTSDGRYFHTYSVSWSGQRRMDTPVAPTPSNEGLWGFFKKLFPTGTSTNTLPLSRCDGPCSDMKPLREMVSIGLCEHVVCHHCLNSAPRISVNENGSGCPNKNCYEDDTRVRNRLKQLNKLRETNAESIDVRKKTNASALEKLDCPITKSLCVEECKTTDSCKKIAQDRHLSNKLKNTFRNAMLNRDVDTATSVDAATTEDDQRRNAFAIIPSSMLEAPHRPKPQPDTTSSVMRTIHLKVIEKTSKWFVKDLPGDWELIDALKSVLRSHRIKASSTGLNLLSKMPHKDAEEKQWTRIDEKQLTMPVKKVTTEEDLYLCLKILG